MITKQRMQQLQSTAIPAMEALAISMVEYLKLTGPDPQTDPLGAAIWMRDMAVRVSQQADAVGLVFDEIVRGLK